MTDRRINLGWRSFLPPLAALSVAWSAALDASEIYKWISDDGVVHYSDTKPKDDAAVTTLEFTDLNPQDYDPATDPYSILNQAKRANESWQQRVAAPPQAESRPQEARYEAQYASSPTLRSTYYPATAYYPLVPAPRQWRPNPGAARRQLNALESLDLSGQRPTSINSGVHQQRVLRSETLPVVSPNTASGSRNSR